MSDKNKTEESAKGKLILNYNFYQPTSKQKKQLLLAFAHKNKAIYGKAYDLIKSKKSTQYDNSYEFSSDNVDEVILYELKSTNNAKVKKNFEKYFFGLSAAEVLLSQTLGEQYKFILYNILTDEVMELNRQELFAKANKIYPTWSIEF